MVRLLMIHPRKISLPCFVLVMLALVGCASQDRRDASQTAGTAEPIEVYTWEQWRIAGQLSPEDYERQARAGTTLVINLRTQPEIDRLEFDPRAEVEGRGMRYVHIPMGGDEGYTPEQVDAFARAVEDAPGPILVHCASGGRARYMWAAYLFEEQDLPLDQAMLRMEDVGGEPRLMERLLGHRLHYTLGEPLPEARSDPSAEVQP